MRKNIVAVLVKNQFGVLNRVTSMFRRRQFNISTLTVSETESSELSRITVTFDGDATSKQQLINQLYKLPDVCSVQEFNEDNSISSELMLLKISNHPEKRAEIHATADSCGAQIVNYSRDSIVFQITGDSSKLDEFVELMRDYTILEICRTGIVSLEKGATTISKITNF